MLDSETGEMPALDESIVAQFADAYRTGDPMRASAVAWFRDITLVRDATERASVMRLCGRDGYMPIMEQHPRLGLLLHSLATPGGDLLRKRCAALFGTTARGDPPRRVARVAAVRPSQTEAERAIQGRLVTTLRALGFAVREYVHCDIGFADVVTPEAVYEVKASLSRRTLHAALGQVLLYRASINPALRAVIAGPGRRGAAKFRPWLQRCGVELLFVEPEVKE